MASDCGISPTFSQTHVFKPGTEQADLYGVMALVGTLLKPRPDLTDQLWTTFAVDPARDVTTRFRGPCSGGT